MPVRPSPKVRGDIPFAAPIPKPDVTAAELSRHPHFKARCEAEGVKPTKRQARRYLAESGRWAPSKVVVA